MCLEAADELLSLGYDLFVRLLHFPSIADDLTFKYIIAAIIIGKALPYLPDHIHSGAFVLIVLHYVAPAGSDS